MPRNSSGTYTLPAGNPVVPNTLIETTWANPTMSDVGSELTNSLDRQGRGSMLAPLKLTDGTAVAPSLSFSSESTSGVYRIASNNLGISIAGALVLAIAAAGATLTGNLAVSGTLTAASIVGPLLVTPGTAALPGYSFTGDPNTGVSAQVADTLVLSTAGLARLTTGPSGNHVMAAPSAGITLALNGAQALLTLTTTVARGSGGNYVEFIDPTGNKGFLGYTGANDNMLLRNTLAGSLSLATNATNRIDIGSAGNVTINAPSSGATLAISAVASGVAQTFTDGTVSGAIRFDATTFAVGSTSAHTTAIWANAAARATIGASGNVTVNAPSSGIALTINAASGGAYTIDNVTAGAATDYALHLFTGTGATGFLGLGNSGVGNTALRDTMGIGTQSADPFAVLTGNLPRVLVGSSGNVTINAPSSSRALDVTGVAGAQVARFNGGNEAGAYIELANAGTARGYVGIGSSLGGSAATDFGIRSEADLKLFSGGANTGLVVTSDRRLYGTALHNNAGSVTGTTNQYIASGTYTPTVTNQANLTAQSAVGTWKWTRVGNVVALAGQIQLTINLGSTSTIAGVSLPIASNFTGTQDAQGNGNTTDVSTAGFPPHFVVNADTTNDVLQVSSTSGSTSAGQTRNAWVVAQYVIL